MFLQQFDKIYRPFYVEAVKEESLPNMSYHIAICKPLRSEAD